MRHQRHAWGNALNVVVAGNYAYVVLWNYGGLRVINVAEPGHARGRDRHLCHAGGDLCGLAIAGSYAYVADWRAAATGDQCGGPRPRPVEVGPTSRRRASDDVAAAGSYAYVAAHEGGMIILRFTGGGHKTYLPLIIH